MAANRMLERIRRGEKALGVALSSPSEELVEMYGRMGLDWVDFEGQHAALTSETVERLCRVADGFGITPTMRIPDHAESTILSFLDRGIKAMWVPNLQTKEEAEALVRYSFFAPIGLRSFTSRRVGKMGLHGGAKALMAEVNANTVIVPQLESITALNNLDEILTVDGIDYFGWGSNDLAWSMGHVGEPGHPSVVDAQDRALEKIHAAGKRLIGEVTESISVVGVLHDAGKSLLAKHGR